MSLLMSIIWKLIVVLIIVLLIVVVATGYKKAPPDTAFIISGLRKKIIIGKASVKIPFFERMDKLSLKLIAIDVKTSNAVPTADYINIQVDAAVNVKISSEPKRLALAAENFLNQNTQYIAGIAREVLEGNMREIVGRMRLEEMVSDRQKFANLVKENAEPDLAAMGLDIVSFNVQNFADGNGVIDDLGIDNISQIKKKAKQPVIMKLSPNVTDIAEMSRAAESAGADALSMINTITGMKIDIHRKKFVLANKTGGMSGPAIKPVAVRMVYQAAHAVQIPIIGMGGIANAEDAIEFLLAGASAVAVGAMNFVNPYATIEVAEGIETYMERYGIENVSELIGAVEE